MLLAACLLAVAGQKTVDPAELDALLLRFAGDGWSGTALVARGGKPLLAKGYGFADFQSNRLNTESTLFEIASITKSFTASAVLALAQQKELALDDSIALHLPGVPAHSREITLRELLSHTSGVPGNNTAGRGEDLALAVGAYLGAGPQTKPGTKWEYWNGGYALLAGVIEGASGRAYTEYLEEELFAPAGMGDTGFTGDGDLDPQHAASGLSSHGPARSALEHPYGSYGYQYRGMGGIVTSVLDLLKWDRALASSAVLDPEHTRELFTVVAGGYALGWNVGRAADGSPRQQHGGAVRGFVSDFRRLPQHDACIAVLSNTDAADARAIADDLECLLLGRALEHPAPKVEGLPWEEAQSYAGTYSAAEGRLFVRASAGVLMAGFEGQELLDRLVGAPGLDWKADFAELTRRAVEIVEAIGKGNTEPLRKHMAQRIPKSWPTTMQRDIWPAQVNAHGPLRGVRPVGAVAHDGRVEVLLERDHEYGPARALVAFSPAGLELLDWNGPAFPASARLVLVRPGTFDVELGGERHRLEFERVEKRVRTVKLAGLQLGRE